MVPVLEHMNSLNECLHILSKFRLLSALWQCFYAELNVLPSFAIILMRKRELVDLLKLSSWCLVTVSALRFMAPQAGLQCLVEVHALPDHTGSCICSMDFLLRFLFHGIFL